MLFAQSCVYMCVCFHTLFLSLAPIFFFFLTLLQTVLQTYPYIYIYTIEMLSNSNASTRKKKTKGRHVNYTSLISPYFNLWSLPRASTSTIGGRSDCKEYRIIVDTGYNACIFFTVYHELNLAVFSGFVLRGAISQSWQFSNVGVHIKHETVCKLCIQKGDTLFVSLSILGRFRLFSIGPLFLSLTLFIMLRLERGVFKFFSV